VSVPEPELAELTPAEFSLSPELEAELTELDTEFAPGSEPDASTTDPWNSGESQSTVSEEPDTEPSETPKV
jgi:hypothetical protein